MPGEARWRAPVSIVPIIGRAIGSLLVWSPVPRLAEAAGWSYEIPRRPRRGSGAVTVITHTHRRATSTTSASFRNTPSPSRLGLGRVYYFFSSRTGALFSIARDRKRNNLRVSVSLHWWNQQSLTSYRFAVDCHWITTCYSFLVIKWVIIIIREAYHLIIRHFLLF